MQCGQFIAKAEDDAGPGRVNDRAPWHFWLLVVAVVVYLGWRLIQGIAWVAGRL